MDVRPSGRRAHVGSHREVRRVRCATAEHIASKRRELNERAQRYRRHRIDLSKVLGGVRSQSRRCPHVLALGVVELVVHSQSVAAVGGDGGSATEANTAPSVVGGYHDRGVPLAGGVWSQ